MRTKRDMMEEDEMRAREKRLISGWVERKGPRRLCFDTKQDKRNFKKNTLGFTGMSNSGLESLSRV